jgi:hypothetical protein
MQLFATMASNGAELLWSIGGWGNDGDWANLNSRARANLEVLLKWSGVNVSIVF